VWFDGLVSRLKRELWMLRSCGDVHYCDVVASLPRLKASGAVHWSRSIIVPDKPDMFVLHLHAEHELITRPAYVHMSCRYNQARETFDTAARIISGRSEA
jgi:hypothetical protein